MTSYHNISYWNNIFITIDSSTIIYHRLLFIKLDSQAQDYYCVFLYLRINIPIRSLSYGGILTD